MHWNFETITCPTVHAFPSDFAREKPDDQIQEISDDDQDDEDNDDYGPEQEEQMSCKEIITTLDKMRRCTVFDEESQKMLTAVTKKIEDLQIKCKKQASIKDFFL